MRIAEMFRGRNEDPPPPPAPTWDDRLAALLAEAEALVREADAGQLRTRVGRALATLLRERDEQARIEKWRQIDREAGPVPPVVRSHLPGHGTFVGVTHPSGEAAPEERSPHLGRFFDEG